MMLSLRYRRELPTREATLYVVCAVLCAYVHYFGLILVVLQGAALAALAYRKQSQRGRLQGGNPSPLTCRTPNLLATSRNKNDPVPGVDRLERRPWRVK